MVLSQGLEGWFQGIACCVTTLSKIYLSRLIGIIAEPFGAFRNLWDFLQHKVKITVYKEIVGKATIIL